MPSASSKIRKNLLDIRDQNSDDLTMIGPLGTIIVLETSRFHDLFSES